MEMKLLLDLRPLQGETKYHGIGRVTKELVWRLSGIAQFEIIYLFSSLRCEDILNLQNITKEREIKREFFDYDNFSSYYDIFLKKPTNYLKIWKNYELLFEYKISQVNPDFYFLFYFFDWMNPTSLGKINKSSKTLCMAYDLIPYIFSDSYLKELYVREFYKHKFSEIHLADFYFAISKNTKKDLINIANIPDEKIEVTYLGYDSKFRPLDEYEKKIWKEKLRDKIKLKKDFILYNPSGADERKNINRLIKAFSLLPEKIKENYCLVLTSKIDNDVKFSIKQYADSVGVGDNLIITDYVTDDELVALYNLCKLFVYPSLYEGFGLPVVEAMACNAPVIGSYSSAVTEIIVEKDALFDPYNENEISEKIYNALSNTKFLNFLIQN
ncbi:MAG: glycosyltransferase family 1 protein, partial [Candidatus Aenigmatarchaeota archaeon]